MKPLFKPNRVITLSDYTLYKLLKRAYSVGKNDGTEKDFNEFAQEVLDE